MVQQFDVRLFYGKPSNLWLILSGMLMLGIMARLFAYLGLPAMLGDDGLTVFCIGLVLLVFAGLWRYLRQQVIDCIATVTTDRLTIARQGAEVLTTVSFARVATYRYMETRGVHWMIFTMTTGNKIKIAGNDLFGAIGAFPEMVQAIEQAAQLQQQLNSRVMVRDGSLF
jgi:hypothetical protein